MGTFESRGRSFEHWRALLEAYLREPFRWDLPDRKVLYTDDDKDIFVCRNNVLQHIIGIIEMALIAPDIKVSDDDAREAKNLIRMITSIAKDRGADDKTEKDMEEIRFAVERCVEILNGYRS
jgi:hypothetical protein